MKRFRAVESIAPSGALFEEDEEAHAGEKTADVGDVGDAGGMSAGRLGSQELKQDLEANPDEEEHPGGNLHDPDDGSEEHDGEDSRVGKVQQVSAEDTADGAAGADQGNLGVGSQGGEEASVEATPQSR